MAEHNLKAGVKRIIIGAAGEKGDLDASLYRRRMCC